ncbi:MAG TPA: hypothetical protein VMR54_04905 [Thermoanaerobaculia bacterium]|nr:hypothetical protein [Thermoanaerobaculia bacterium]
MKEFLRRTVLGGFFVVLPVIVILIVLKRVDSSIRAAMEPFAAALPLGTRVPALWALLALVLLSIIAGLILQLPVVRKVYASVTDWLAGRSSAFGFLRGFEKSVLEKTGNKPLKAALAELDGGLVPAIVVEELADGRYVVFVPSVPSPNQGSIYIFARERVHLIDASVHRVTSCVGNWGVGAGELVKAMRKPG